MKARILAVAFVAILAVPAIAAAATYSDLGPKTEQVIEGHNTFAVIQAVINRNITGVTVLVREQVISGGKLWFNDQYLIRPDQAVSGLGYNLTDCAFRPDGSYACNRYPCGGAVIATESGNPNPIASVGLDGRNFGRFLEEETDGIPVVEDEVNIHYIESYQIRDPNDHDFVIDKYVVDLDLGDVDTSEDWDDVLDANGDGEDSTDALTDAEDSPYHFDLGPQHTGIVMSYPIWVVNILGSSVFIADDGSSNCGAFIDNPPAGYFEPTDPLVNGGATYCYDGNPALNGEVPGAGCAYDAYGTPTSINETFSIPDQIVVHNFRRYNAEVIMYMKDFQVTTKDGKAHGAASSDTNGCDSDSFTRYEDGTESSTQSEWYCPAGNDDNEGNSHPFNPIDGGAGTPDHAHDTARVDLYFSSTYRPVEPAARTFAIYDVEGSGAPFDFRHP